MEADIAGIMQTVMAIYELMWIIAHIFLLAADGHWQLTILFMELHWFFYATLASQLLNSRPFSQMLQLFSGPSIWEISISVINRVK